MLLRSSRSLCAIGVVVAGCSHSSPPPAAPPPVVPAVQLAVMPAESDVFPQVARALSSSLADAKIVGVDRTTMSKVSLEVVQLSIECVDPTTACYEAVGRSLAVNRLLFARIERGAAKPAKAKGKAAKARPLKVSVTLFDVDARAAARTAEKTFASEDDATAGAAALVAEVAR